LKFIDQFMEASTVLEVGGASHTYEWKGQAPSKFNGSRKHIPEPKLKEVPHPLYTINKKRNFEQKLSATHEWRPSVRVNNAKD